MYKDYEHAQNEVEKLRQDLYPNLYAANDETSDASKLETIAEDTNDLTDTNNDFTEDTSEAHGSGSDDEVRGTMDEGEENISRSDDEGDAEPVRSNNLIHFFRHMYINVFFSFSHRFPRQPNKNWNQNWNRSKSNAHEKIWNLSRRSTKCLWTVIRSECEKR